MTIQFVPETAVPARVAGEEAKAKLAEYREAQAAKRAIEAKPILAGLMKSQAATDGTTYETAAAAGKVADGIKRLVTPGLKAEGRRPAVRVSPSGKGFVWHVTAVVIPVEAAAE